MRTTREILLRKFRKRRYRKENNLIFIQKVLEEQYRFDDSAEIRIINGQVRFSYEFFEHHLHGTIQSEGFTAFIENDYTMNVVHYKILHDEFVDVTHLDATYFCRDVYEMSEILEHLIEGEG